MALRHLHRHERPRLSSDNTQGLSTSFKRQYVLANSLEQSLHDERQTGGVDGRLLGLSETTFRLGQLSSLLDDGLNLDPCAVVREPLPEEISYLTEERTSTCEIFVTESRVECESFLTDEEEQIFTLPRLDAVDQIQQPRVDNTELRLDAEDVGISQAREKGLTQVCGQTLCNL